MRGYSIRIAEAIKDADGDLLGVQLGRACLARDVPVAHVAMKLGVTRQTVYNWFMGIGDPRGPIRDAINSFLKDLG